jgi:hypothetical protein
MDTAASQLLDCANSGDLAAMSLGTIMYYGKVYGMSDCVHVQAQGLHGLIEVETKDMLTFAEGQPLSAGAIDLLVDLETVASNQKTAVLSTSLVTTLIEIGKTSDKKKAHRIGKRYSKLFSSPIGQLAMVMHDTENHWAGVTISKAGKISIFNSSGAHGNPAFLARATQIITALRFTTAEWKDIDDTGSRRIIFCPQQSAGSNDCGLFATWFLCTIREHGAWTGFSATLPPRFQRDVVVESMLNLIEKTYNIMIRPNLEVVRTTLANPKPTLPQYDQSIAPEMSIELSSPSNQNPDQCFLSRSSNNSPISPYLPQGGFEEGIDEGFPTPLCITPDISVDQPGQDEPNPYAWDPSKLPDHVDLDASLQPDRLHAEGKILPNVPEWLSPLQLQCIAKNRLFSAPTRNRMEWVTYLLDRYSHMIQKWFTVADAMEPDSTLASLHHEVRNTSMVTKHAGGTRPTYSLRVQPVVVPTPVAKARFRKEQMGRGNVQNWDPNLDGKLALAKLPMPKRRRLFILKTRSSVSKGGSRAISSALATRLEPVVWAEFAKSFGHLASTTHGIWRTSLPNTKIPAELVNLLKETDFWVHEHTHVEASKPWPESTSVALAFIDFMRSLGR